MKRASVCTVGASDRAAQSRLRWRVGVLFSLSGEFCQTHARYNWSLAFSSDTHTHARTLARISKPPPHPRTHTHTKVFYLCQLFQLFPQSKPCLTVYSIFNGVSTLKKNSRPDQNQAVFSFPTIFKWTPRAVQFPKSPPYVLTFNLGLRESLRSGAHSTVSQPSWFVTWFTVL